ncbi:hypothetical protein PR048_011319 [Dryococelus australis]|uniref:Uncharacterized protein n=1 Tax=Dryococelus australis TaxID=614101 RepID=A0ABQ9HL95_9NEOP|nr:hypothetical protein PR048_011319 [Dryococelus australis]
MHDAAARIDNASVNVLELGFVCDFVIPDSRKVIVSKFIPKYVDPFVIVTFLVVNTATIVTFAGHLLEFLSSSEFELTPATMLTLFLASGALFFSASTITNTINHTFVNPNKHKDPFPVCTVYFAVQHLGRAKQSCRKYTAFSKPWNWYEFASVNVGTNYGNQALSCVLNHMLSDFKYNEIAHTHVSFTSGVITVMGSCVHCKYRQCDVGILQY